LLQKKIRSLTKGYIPRSFYCLSTMATNNYYGFTHGGTQYTNQYTTQQPANQGYATAQQQYTHTPPPNTAAPPQQTQAYTADSYVISGYTRPAGQATQAAQSYYPQQAQQQTYSTPITTGKSPAVARPAATSTAYPSYSANTAGTTSSSYAGFSHQAPTQQQPTTKLTAYAQGGSSGAGRGQGLGYKRTPGHHMNKLKGPRPAPKPQALHYCDVCKISCAGPQTYKEHLEGQKHKKKEAAQKAGMPTVSKGSPAGLRCELCDVTCTGSDAYAAHIRGAKHQKVLKLHTKLGKPIPSDNPTVIASPATTTPAQPQSAQPAGSVLKQIPITNSSASNSQQTNAGPTATSFAKPVTPKINFIGPKTDFDRYTPSANVNSAADTNGDQTTAQISTSYTAAANSTSAASSTNSSSQAQLSTESSKTPEYVEKDIQPVGQDYIEEVRSDEGKVVSFNCKLCECRFNDPNAKEMHMKGRRHRLQYKKKVNPDLVVDVKPSSRQKKIEERRSARNTSLRRGQQEPFPRGPPVPLIPPVGPRGFGPGPAYGGPNPLFFIPPLIRRPESMEDRHVMAKHAEIYPKEEELHAIQKIVSNTEKALKFVSDHFADTDAKKVNGVKQEEGTETTAKSEAELQASRILKGVMRVGHLAKGLLLKGDRSVQLVVLCSERPTITMLNRVADGLPKQLQIVAPEETYDIQKKAENAAIIVSSTVEPKIEVTVTLTSPLLRTAGSEAAGG
jgi:zinc finger RNA-binding protein